MREIVIVVDIYCEWFNIPPAYRLYVDQELLTERTYIWKNDEQFIRETMVVKMAPGEHLFRIAPVNPRFIGFRYTNLKVDGKPVETVTGQFTLN